MKTVEEEVQQMGPNKFVNNTKSGLQTSIMAHPSDCIVNTTNSLLTQILFIQPNSGMVVIQSTGDVNTVARSLG